MNFIIKRIIIKPNSQLVKCLLLFVIAMVGISVKCSAQKNCLLGQEIPPLDIQNHITKRSTGPVFEIPVVFHVVGNEALHDKMSVNSLEELLNYCNEVFKGSNQNLIDVRPEFEPILGVANIRLVLETVIYQTTEKQFVKSIWGSEDNLEDAKISLNGGSDPYDIHSYLNVWICDIFQPNGKPNNFTQGYATPPIGAPGWPEFDLIQGVLIDDQVVERNRIVFVHELGHYFGLRHLVEINQSSCIDNDGIADTPVMSRSPECRHGDSCPEGQVDMTENIMNPQVLECRMAFTKGQVRHMRYIIENFRPFLFNEIQQPTQDPLDEPLIYPNPVIHKLNLVFEDDAIKFINLNLYNETGISIFSDYFAATNKTEIDLSDFIPGVYYLHMKYKNRLEVRKIVKM